MSSEYTDVELGLTIRAPSSVMDGFLKTWLQKEVAKEAPSNLTVLKERPDQRPIVEKAIKNAVLDNLVGVEIIESMGGFAKAAAVIRNALPVSKRARSGDFGEILATEYIAQLTEFEVPIRRLRFKDDRAVAMRGDDVLAFEFRSRPTRILKTESKSRAHLGAATTKEACDGLCRNNGRPNPSTLSFISRRLREHGRHEIAVTIENLQESDIPIDSVSHLIFTLSANNPVTALSAVATSPIQGVRRNLVGCVVEDHASLIKGIFESLIDGAHDGNN